MIEVKRKGDERADVMMRRFNREVQLSGVLTVVKKRRYFEREPNRLKRRRSAIRSSLIRQSRRGY